MGSLTGAFGLTRHVFDRWREFDPFASDIDDACHIMSLRTGLRFKVDPARLLTAHATWVRACEEWLEHLLPEETTVLSHLKRAALLLDKLCENTPVIITPDVGIRATRAIDPQDGGGQLDLPTKLPEREIQKFLDGGSHYFAWLLTYHICEFFESQRTDRLDTYEPKITDEFEIDMVSCLLSGKTSGPSLHMILKALFLRD